MGNKIDRIVKSGMSFTTTLVMILATLKIIGLSDMSWWWVFSPWIISTSFTVLFLVGIGLIIFLVDTTNKLRKK